MRAGLAAGTVDESGPTTWQRYDDLGNADPLTPAATAAPAAFSTSGTGWAAHLDVLGNVLATWQVAGAAAQAQWYGPDLTATSVAFPFSGAVRAFPGGGFAVLDSSGNWIGVLRPGQPAVSSAPPGMAARGARAFETVFSGRALAFQDAACTSNRPCTTKSAEIVAADGTSCGILAVLHREGTAEPFIVTPAGTIVDGAQETVPYPNSQNGTSALFSRWWSGVLR